MTSLDRRTVLLSVFGAAALAGCTGRSSPELQPAAASPSPTPTPSVDTRPRWPLSGVLMEDPEAGRHAAVAVKVPDNENEHPQAGLDRADIVFVELDGYRDAAGYSGTRLVPLFHSSMPDDVGPVRSMRPVDVALLSPVGALIGSTGATRWVVDYVAEHADDVDGSLTYLETKGSGAYSIDPDRVRTYQGVTYYDRAVLCHPKVLAKQTTHFRSGPKQAYFPWASTDAEVSTAAGTPARTIRVPWKQGDSYDMGYVWNEQRGRYLRSMPWGPHVLSSGKRVATDNILVIQAGQHYSRHEPVHEIENGTGVFTYAHGGAAVTGTWSKGHLDATFSFTLDDGQPLKMAPGQTYVELARTGARIRITG